MLKDLPLVSVAVVTYNHQDFITDCLESIIMQDYPNFEIIVSDDGSQDKTQEIIKNYQKKYPNKFKIHLSEINNGVATNCNIALKLCTGKYIILFAGDDIMLQKKISIQTEKMESDNNISLSFHNLEVFDSIKNIKLFNFTDKLFNFTKKGTYKNFFTEGNFLGAPSVMFLRDKMPINGLDESIKYSNDTLFFLEILLNGGNYVYIDLILVRYRKHLNNLSTLKNKELYLDDLNMCNILILKYPEKYKYIKKLYSRNISNCVYLFPHKNNYFFKYSLQIDFNFKMLGRYIFFNNKGFKKIFQFLGLIKKIE